MVRCAAVLCLWPLAALADQAPGPLPHSCSIVAACEGSTCVQVYLPVGFTMEGTAWEQALVGSSGRSVPLGRFDSLSEAEDYLRVSGAERDFGSFLVPFDGVADAVGWDLHAVQSRGGVLSIAPSFSRLICN